MRTSDAGLQFIANFEGFSAVPYLCPASLKTIGYGHVIRANEHFTSITEDEARKLLHSDVASSENAVTRLIQVTMNQNQFDALVSFTFNIGAGALQQSTLRRKLNRGEYVNAANELLRWVYTYKPIKTKLPGLVLRRIAERRLFLCDI